MLDLRSSFGLAVRAVRAELGWSQERLSVESGLDRTYVSGLERGQRNPALQTLVRLADALGVPLHELVKRAEEGHVPFTFSQVATQALTIEDLCITDLRDAPIRNRSTKFRLAQQNMLAYTFPSFVPGFAEAGVNGMSYGQIIDRPIENAMKEGQLLYGVDFSVSPAAVAKVAGDIFEIISSAVLWNAAARWNAYMRTGGWTSAPRYGKPNAQPAPSRQVAVLNLPRDYDWVQLLVPEARDKIEEIRAGLGGKELGLPTSTPDLAVVVVPEELRELDLWADGLPDLKHPSQAELRHAHKLVEGRVEPGEIVLAVAFKKSLRSDRLYQPLYEANVMQLLLEGRLGAPGWSSRSIPCLSKGLMR
ncbi:Cfr10I/Bse634I family restriction endonuclease [Streptomyces parvulus]|nr:Cfr10I/Bse634I family restriction endonuclease [Streptomyces parvulus]